MDEIAILFPAIQVVYYGSIIAASFLSCMASACIVGHYRNCWHVFSISALAGLFGFAVVCTFDGDAVTRNGNEIEFYPLAIFVGFAIGLDVGYAKKVTNLLLKKIGLPEIGTDDTTICEIQTRRIADDPMDTAGDRSIPVRDNPKVGEQGSQRDQT